MHTIGDWIRLNARKDPRREAFVGIDGRVTFGEAAERAWQLARGLRAVGISVRDTVGVLAGNTLFNAEAFLGIAAAGAVYAAYNWRWTAGELADGIIESKVSVILVEDRFGELLTQALAEVAARQADTEAHLPRLLLQGEVERLRTGAGPFDSNVKADDLLCLLFTGGSTGKSKAVALSHRAALTTYLNEKTDCKLGLDPLERALILTPLFHVASLLCWLVTHFVSGKTSILADRFDEETLVDLVGSERITNTFMIPNMMRRVMQAGVFDDPSFRRSFKALHTGAGLLDMADKERFIEALPDARLYYRYGLTEAGPMGTRLLPKDMLRPEVDGSIGQQYSFTQVTLRRIGNDDEQVQTGEPGEICMRGPSLMSGYFGRPEETSKAIRGGWLHTGDIATRDDEGFYFFQDRIKEMIKSGGENVYSAEVEQRLYLHPAVLETVVVGVPDQRWGEEVRAVVVLRDGETASARELQDFVRSRLAGYKVPKEIVFVGDDTIPRSGAGKVIKSQLKEDLGWQ